MIVITDHIADPDDEQNQQYLLSIYIYFPLKRFFMLSTQPIIDEMLSAFQWNIKLTIWKANDYETIFMPPERADLPDQIAVPHVCYGIHFLYTWLLLCCFFFSMEKCTSALFTIFWELHFLCLIACFNSIPCSEFTGTLSKHEWRRRKFEGTFFPPKSMNRKNMSVWYTQNVTLKLLVKTRLCKVQSQPLVLSV